MGPGERCRTLVQNWEEDSIAQPAATAVSANAPPPAPLVVMERRNGKKGGQLGRGLNV